MVISHFRCASAGSILGPVLFVIFINNLPDIINTGTEIALYADDTKIHRHIISTRKLRLISTSNNKQRIGPDWRFFRSGPIQ
jgi:mannose/fructose/N-acetylgalactosamine-specific phosphotransferase system component IID